MAQAGVDPKAPGGADALHPNDPLYVDEKLRNMGKKDVKL